MMSHLAPGLLPCGSMRRIFLIISWPALVLAWFWGSGTQPGHAEEAYYYLRLNSVIPNKSLRAVGEPGSVMDRWEGRAVLDTEGEVFLRRTTQGERFLAISAPAGKSVSGRFFAVTNAAPIPFVIAADQANPTAKWEYLGARQTYYGDLLERDIPGAAWFRHQERESAKAIGNKAMVMNRPDRFPFRRQPDLFDGDQSFDLFSGGRAISENLQLDRVLRATKNEQPTSILRTSEESRSRR